MQSAIYLFGFARGDLHPDFVDLSPSLEVFQEKCGDITAIISRVVLDEYVGEKGEANLRDLSWLGPRVVGHGAVLQTIMRDSPVLPVRFGTLFSSLASIRSILDGHHSEITEFLDFMKDKEEWGIKAHLSRTEAREKLFAEELKNSGTDPEALSPGARYFRQKQLKAASEKKMEAWISATLKEVEQKLLLISVDLCRRKIHSGFDSGNELETTANWAALILADHHSQLNDLLEQAGAGSADLGLSFELSGPWPPYSFAPQLDMEN